MDVKIVTTPRGPRISNYGQLLKADELPFTPPSRVLESPGRLVTAKVLRWKDGDTVQVSIMLDFVGLRDAEARPSIRLYGADTPERGQPNWREATVRANELAPVGTEVTLLVYLVPEKYGRTVAEVITSEGVNVGRVLTEEGLIKP